METQGGRTTTLGTIRSFLRAERREPPPWAPPTRAVDELYALLRERRDDDLFWARLRDLAERLQDHRFSSEALARAEAIDGNTVDRLLDDLRASLDGNEEQRRTLKDWLGSAISGAALAGFLLLGSATACEEGDDDTGADSDADSDSDSDSDSDTDNYDTCAAAITEGFTGETAEVYCDLIVIINDADISASDKQELLDCLPELDADYRQWLLEHFDTLTEQQIADYLEDMVGPYGLCSSGSDSDTDTH